MHTAGEFLFCVNGYGHLGWGCWHILGYTLTYQLSSRTKECCKNKMSYLIKSLFCYSWSDLSSKGRKKIVTELESWYWDKISVKVNKIFYDVGVWNCPKVPLKKPEVARLSICLHSVALYTLMKSFNGKTLIRSHFWVERGCFSVIQSSGVTFWRCIYL